MKLAKIWILLVLIAFLSSCSAPCEWILQRVETSCPSDRSARLSYSSDTCFTKLELQLDTASRVYLNRSSGMFPGSREGFTSVTLSCRDEFFTVEAYRLKGGQRLLFPPETATWIIEQLWCGDTITVIIKRAEIEIPAGDFCKKYQKFLFARKR